MSHSIINVAICSFGVSGKLFHAPFVHLHPGFKFYACWERSKKLVNDIYPDVISFDNLDEMLTDPAVDLVIVNTPSYSHFEYAKKALEANKHVIVEKPFVATSEQGEILINIAREHNKMLSVYQNRRHDADFLTIKKVLNEKLLGRVVEVEMHYDRYAIELSYKTHKETGGPATGGLYDLGSHLIDEALVLFGWPQAVFGDLRVVRSVSKVDDYFELLLYYEGLRVRLHSTVMACENTMGYILHGEFGSFVKPKTNVQEEALMVDTIPESEGWGIENPEDWGWLYLPKDGEIIRQKYPSEPGNYMEFYNGIYNALTKKVSLPVTAEEGLNVIRIIEAARESSTKGCVITLPQ